MRDTAPPEVMEHSVWRHQRRVSDNSKRKRTSPLTAQLVGRFLSLSENQFIALIALAFGIIDAVLLLGWRQIDPRSISWLKGDAACYQIGWEFLRHQNWTFPPVWLAHLNYPFGVSAAYLDVIPIVAVPLRLVTSILPTHFQYLGAYALVCLVLQCYFGMKLLSCFTTDRILILIGGLFFLDSPILLFRVFAGHFSLCSHWLIVAAIYFYFRPVKPSSLAAYLAPFALLAAVSAGITPYLAIMVQLLGFAALFRIGLENSTGDAGCTTLPGVEASVLPRLFHRSRIIWAAILIGSTAMSLVFFGFVIFGGSPALADKGYGMFSMNLLSPIAALGLSSFPDLIHVFPNQNEGYNYLGAGVVLLGTISMVRHRASLSKIWSPSLRPLVILSAILALLALSVRVTAGQTVLFILPVSPQLFHLLAIFRASGRFFWPVWYLLMTGAIVGGALTMRGQRSRRAILAAALAVQLFDILPLRASVMARAGVDIRDPLVAPEWMVVAHAYRHLVILPARQCNAAVTPANAESWPFFASFAARHGLTLNSVYAARISSKDEELNCTVLPRDVAAGRVRRDTAYVLSDELAGLAAGHGLHCERLDGFQVCTVSDGIRSSAGTATQSP